MSQIRHIFSYLSCFAEVADSSHHNLSGHCIIFWHIFYAAVESQIHMVDSVNEHLWFFFLFIPGILFDLISGCLSSLSRSHLWSVLIKNWLFSGKKISKYIIWDTASKEKDNSDALHYRDQLYTVHCALLPLINTSR